MDPRLFNDWAQVLRPAAHADPELVVKVRDAIDRLPARQRDVLNGLFYEGITKTEIAARLRVSRHEVRRLMLAAMATLTKRLA